MIIDNAADEEQVRPLLPGLGECACIITSRIRFADLPRRSESPWNRFRSVRVLNFSKQLLESMRSEHRKPTPSRLLRHAEDFPWLSKCPQPKSRIVHDPCRSWPRASPAEHHAETDTSILDQLGAGDLDVRKTISLGYLEQRAEVRKAFELLGVSPTQEWADWILCPLMGIPLPESEKLLSALVDAQLLKYRATPDLAAPRYFMHDLVREFSRECGRNYLTEEEREEALRST